MEAPSSRVVLVQGMRNEAEREPSRKLVKETLGKSEEKRKDARGKHTSPNEEHGE